MEVVDVGSPVTITAETKVKEPFDPEKLEDLSNIKVTVYDPNDDVKVNDQPMTKKYDGKFFHIVQTETDWVKGFYRAKVTGDYGGYNDITLKEEIFRLK